MRHLRRLLTLLILALGLVACEPLTLNGSRPGPTAAPAAPGAPAVADYPPLPEGLPRAQVLRVVDGDTIAIRLRGREERVRLIGINTPESVDPRRPVQCFGKEASANAETMLDGRTVLLEDDPTQGSRDSSGRLLRYIWLEDGRMANLEQLAGGFAAEYTYEQPYRYRELFRNVQREAEQAGRGLWAPTTCNGQFLPAGQAPNSAATPATRPGDQASCPSVPRSRSAPEAPVQIVGLDKSDETVRLRNVGDTPVQLDGWLVCSQRGDEAQRGITGVLGPGETRSFTNRGGPIWSNGARDDAALFDPNGQLVSYWEDR